MFRYSPHRQTLPCVFLLFLIFLSGCESSIPPEEGVKRAEDYLDKGNSAAAVIELKNVLQEHPEHQNARVLLGEIFLQKRDAANAITQLKKARDLNPGVDIRVSLGKALLLQSDYSTLLKEITLQDADSAAIKQELNIQRAYAYLFTNDFDNSSSLFKEILATDEKNQPAMVGQAMLVQANGDFNEATQIIDQALAVDETNMDAWIIKGKISLLQQDYVSSGQDFEQAIANNHQQFTYLQPVQAYVYLVQSLIDQKKLVDAEKTVQKLHTINPKHPMVDYLRAIVAYESGKADEALTHIQLFQTKVKDYNPAQLLEGAIHYALGNLEQGDAALTDYLKIHPGSPTATKLLASSQIKSHHSEKAYELISPLLKQDPDNPELLMLASHAMINAGNPESAIEMIEKALNQDPENKALKIKLAAALLSNREVDKAVNMLLNLPATSNTLGDREVLLLQAWSTRQQYDRALAFVNEFITVHPDNALAYGYSAAILQRMNKPDEARQHFEKSLSLKPDSPAVIMTLARLESLEKNYTRAQSLIDKLLTLNPDNAGAMYLRSKIFAVNGEQNKAVEWLERSLRASSTVLEPRLILSRYYLEEGNIISAKKAAIEATKIAPNRFDVWTNYSIVQNHTGDHQGAITSLRKAEKLDPANQPVLLTLAQTLIKVEDIPAAKITLQKLIKLAPENFKAAAILALIEMKTGNVEQAFNIAKQQQSYKDNNHSAVILEGDLYGLDGKYKKAIDSYLKAADIQPDASLTIKLYAVSMKTGDASPEGYLQKWLKTNPDDILIRQVLVTHFERIHDDKSAAKEYEILNRIKPDDANILNNLALKYDALNDPRAIATAERAHSLMENSAAISDTLGWMLVNDNNVRRGLALLQNAYTQLPDNPEVGYHYAVALAKSGETDAARKKLKKLVDVQGDFPSRAQAEKYLQSLVN